MGGMLHTDKPLLYDTKPTVLRALAQDRRRAAQRAGRLGRPLMAISYMVGIKASVLGVTVLLCWRGNRQRSSWPRRRR